MYFYVLFTVHFVKAFPYLSVPGPPRSLRIVASYTTDVHLAWDPPVPGPDIIHGYSINYTDSRFLEFFEFRTPDASVTEAIITDLYPATTYYFQAFARTASDVGLGSAVVMQATGTAGKFFSYESVKRVGMGSAVVMRVIDAEGKL